MLLFFVELSKPIKIVLKNHSMTSFLQISHVKSVIVIDKKILTVNDGFAYSFCFQTTTNFQFCHTDWSFFRMKKLYYNTQSFHYQFLLFWIHGCYCVLISKEGKKVVSRCVLHFFKSVQEKTRLTNIYNSIFEINEWQVTKWFVK